MSLIINDKKVAGLYKAYVIQNATNTASGIIRIATEEEIKAGLDSLTAVTPKQLATKQDVLIAGNGLEILEDGTINNTQTSAEWGNIIGNILDQEDLNAILLTKANEEETAYELVYEDSILTLKNRKGDILSTVSINELPDVDDVTIVINEENKLQSIGEKTKSGTFKYTWIGTEAEYTDAKDLGIIDEFTECIIIDSEAEKVVPIVQYEAPTKLSQLANDIEYVTNDELQSVKTSLEEKIDLQTDGAEIVHKVGNETIDGFKNFKQKIVIENGLGKGRIAHKPTDTSLEDGYIEFGEDTLLYGKQNINGELYDEKHNIFHDGNLVAGDNITITEKNGIYTINGEAGGGTDEPSTNVLVDDITIVKDDNDIITTVGVKSKNDTILYDWIGTENEYNIALENGTIQPNWICYITDDISHTDDIRPEIDRLDNVKANKDLSNLSEVGEKHFLNKSQITNCITEIPQRVKYEINSDGKLVVKAGSKYYLPDGSEIFNEKFIINDLLYNFNNTQTDTFLIAISNTGEAGWVRKNNCGYGTAEEADMTVGFYFRSDLKKIFYNKNLEGATHSLPLMEVDVVNGKAVEVRDFNCCGRIASFLWVNEGVKALLSNNKNQDGTLNNIEHTFKTMTKDIQAWDNLANTYTGHLMYVSLSNLSYINFQPLGRFYTQLITPNSTAEDNYAYIKDENQWYMWDNASLYWQKVKILLLVDMQTKNGYFNPKTTFRAVDHNDASGLGMPSSRYIDLELGADGTTYTAPANGWFYLNKKTSSTNQLVSLINNSAGRLGTRIIAPANNTSCYIYIPCKKGDEVLCNYTAGGDLSYFRFIYAEGEI